MEVDQHGAAHADGSQATSEGGTPSLPTADAPRRRQRAQGSRCKKWTVSRQQHVMRGKRPLCGRCFEPIDEGALRCTPTTQRSGCIVHFGCLPSLKEDLELSASPNMAHEELEPLKKRLAASLPADPAIPAAELASAEAMQEEALDTLAAGGLVNAAWWTGQPWIYPDLPQQRQAVQVPKRFRAEYDALKIQLLKAVTTAATGTTEAAAGWKALLNIDGLLMAGPTSSHRAEGLTTQSSLLEVRLRIARRGDWEGLLADVRRTASQPTSARAAPPPPSPAQAATKRAARVSTLAASGEVTRSLRACAATGAARTDADTLPLLHALYPPQPLPAPPAQPTTPDLALAREAAENAVRFLSKPARLSAPGLVAGRAEHWTGTARDAEGSRLLTTLFVRILTGDAPEPALRCLRTGEIVALPKPGGKVRPIVLTPILRRYALRGLMAAAREGLEAAVGPMQFGCGTAGGVEAAVTAVKLASQQWSNPAVLALDTSAAFQHVRRDDVFQQCDTHLPLLTPFMRVWYQQETEHIWRDARGDCHRVSCTGGVEQGDPLAPLAYALAVRPQLEDLSTRMRQRDPKATLVAFLDDTFLVQDVGHMEQAWQDVHQVWAAAGLPLNAGKCRQWLPNGPAATLATPPAAANPPTPTQTAVQDQPQNAPPRGLPPLPPVTPTLPLLGGHLRTAGDTEDAPTNLGAPAGSDLDAATARLQGLWDRLTKLLTAGLSKHVAGALLRSYAGAASQFVLRLSAATPRSVEGYDAALRGIWSQLLQRPLAADDWARACLPCKLGGLGLQSAESRAAAAAWSGLHSALPVASKALPASARSMFHACTANETEAKALLDTLQTMGCKEAFVRLDLHSALDAKARQKDTVRHIHAKRQAELLAALPPHRQAWLRSASGPGAGAFLEPPPGEDMVLTDTAWETACRLRLGLPHAAHPFPPTLPPKCCHVGANGQSCQCECDDADLHALHCNLGGGTLARHNAMARQLGRILHEAFGTQARYEQRVPNLDRMHEGKELKAIMDVVYTTPTGDTGLIDVALVSACAGPASRVEEAARRCGAAAARACAAKVARYGREVTPFVLELAGCASEPARAWIRAAAAELDADPDSYQLHGPTLWARVSVTLQRFVALQLRRAAGLP